VPEPRPLIARLARLRVPLGFVSAVLALWLAQPTRGTLALGTIISLLGEALRVWAAGHLNKSREVTMSGPYRWLAHPLYAGSTLMGIGLAIASNRAIVAVLVVTYLAVTVTAAIKHEEAFLRRAFGGEYDRYRGGSITAPSTRAFSFARAMTNHEPRAIAGLVVAVLLLFLKATYNGSF
jgi:protein-S-isoprenylcysteine O-methyltransferase Ste14